MNFLMTKPLFDEETNFLITRGIQFSIFKRHSLKLTEFRLKLKMEDLPDELRELQEYAAREVLSNVQVAIAVARFHGAKYKEIIRSFSLSGATALTHCLVRTACARPWHPGDPGGTDSYLSPADEDKFKEFIFDACDEVNCLTTVVATSLAAAVKKDRFSRARKVLVKLKCEKLLRYLSDPEPPSRSWLNAVCDHLNVRICRTQELEIARRLWCDRDTIVGWFLQFSTLFDRPLDLMFNMDETHVTSKKTLHCVAPCNRQPLVWSIPAMPHLTAAVTIHGGGRRIKPLVIIPKKKTMSGLEKFDSDVYLASSTSGWMTRRIFRFYALTFVAELAHIRLHWPEDIRDEPVILFLDGHPSRWDFYANLIFWAFNVDVVTFPGHCSHLLQMFDVAIAGPLKTEIKKELSASRFAQFLATLRPEDFRLNRKKNARELRALLIESFFTAFERVTTTKNCRRSYEATGIAPYNPDAVLSSSYAMDPPAQGLFPQRQGPASSKWLTSEETLKEMFRHENGRELTPDDMRLNLAQIYEDLKQANLDQGIPLSKAPEVLLDDRGTYRLFKLEELSH